MSHSLRPALAGYLTILRTRGVGLPILGTAVASLPIGMLGLAVLLMTEERLGTFGTAGAVVAALGTGTGLGIAAQGRLMDRFGCSWVLVCAGALQMVALVGLVLAVREDASPWLIATAAFVAGAGEPQVGGCLRALWPTLVGPEHRASAMALSSIVFELPVISGPFLLTVALLVLSPDMAVLLAGALFVVGAGALAASRATRSWSPVRGRRPGVLGPLTSAPLRRVLMVTAAQGIVTGLLQMSCAATAARQGDPALASLLFAALSTGSLLGTLAYGARNRSGSISRHLAVLTALLVLVLLATALAPTVVLLGLGALGVGLLVGPIAVCCFLEAERSAPSGTAVAAFTSLTAIGLIATAGGSALGGWLLDGGGTAAVLLTTGAAAAALATGAAAVPVGRRYRVGPGA